MKIVRLLPILLILTLVCTTGCSTSSDVYLQPQGPEVGFTHKEIKQQDGFWQHRSNLLHKQGLTKADYVRLSTDSAWHLSAVDRERLHSLRMSIPKPDSTTLLQKVIGMDKLEHFKQNDAKGVLNGFVAVAADVKKLRTSSDIYYGLRLDYDGTKFTPNDKEYAVARFYSNQTDHLRIPFCKEMGGPDEHAWPCSGGGFTTSSLGDGGFPEWFFDVNLTPKEGSEIYVVTDKGKETLVLVYRNGKWVEP